MKKYMVVLMVFFSASLFGSAFESPKEEQQEKITLKWSYYLGVHNFYLSDPMDNGLLFGIETQYMDIPIFQRYSVDGFVSISRPGSCSVGLSSFHYWSNPNKMLRLFSRFVVFKLALFGPMESRYLYATYGFANPTFGIEMETKNHSMARVEVGLPTISATYVF